MDSFENVSATFALFSNSLRFFLTISSVFILFSIVNATLLQQAIDQVLELENFEIFPSSLIYSYGLFFTLFLAILYIPVYYHLKTKGETIYNSLVEKYGPEIKEDRLNVFKNKANAMDTIQIAFTVLSPIIGSTLTDVIKNLAL